MEQPKYALHPGYVYSQTDDQMHYIGIKDLANLYKLEQGEYIVWKDEIRVKYNWNDLVHLYPSETGNYGRPEER